MQVAPTLQEQGVYRTYERERRLRLTRALALVYIVLMSLSIVTLPLELSLSPQTSLISFVPLLATLALYTLAFLLSLRHLAFLSAAILVGATIFVTVEFQYTWALQHGIDGVVLAIFCTYCIFIALAGIVGNPVLLVTVTLISNVLTVIGTLLLPVQGLNLTAGPNRDVVLILLFIQWGAAALLFSAQRQNLRTLRELGDVRIQFERAQQLELLKDQFISNVNHELRTPLGALLGRIQFAQSLATTASEQLQAQIDQAMRIGMELRSFMDAILSVRRLDTQHVGELDIEPVLVREVIERSVDLAGTLEATEPERDLVLAIPEGFRVRADATKLQQVLMNLLTNARKYAPNGPIEITATTVADPHQRRRQLAQISVHDHGEGIPPEQIPLLFQRFVRLPQHLTSTIQGNGLGLYLCRTFIEAMGGTIVAESRGIAGEGATFVIRLPLAN